MKPSTIEPGQSWAIRDDRYDRWKYVTVERVDDDRVLVRPRHRNGRRSWHQARRLLRRSRYSFCGYAGPGRLPAYTGYTGSGCLNCGPRPTTLPPTWELEPGFGFTVVTRDDTDVFFNSGWSFGENVGVVESWARRWPAADWRIRFVGPMSETLYQRHGTSQWVLVWRGLGFA